MRLDNGPGLVVLAVVAIAAWHLIPKNAGPAAAPAGPTYAPFPMAPMQLGAPQAQGLRVPPRIVTVSQLLAGQQAAGLSTVDIGGYVYGTLPNGG